MPYYRIILHGDCVSIPSAKERAVSEDASQDSAGRRPTIGFYTTRIVTAGDQDAAVKKAMSLTNEEWAKNFAKSDGAGPPRLDVDSIFQIDFISFVFAQPRRGFTFYTDPN